MTNRVLDERDWWMKVTINNILGIMYVTGFFAFLFYYMQYAKLEMKDDQLLNILIGAMIASLTIVMQFFFRSSPPPPVIDLDKDGIPDE